MSAVAWVSSISSGKGRFVLLLQNGSTVSGVLKRSLVARWHKDPRRLAVGMAVIVADTAGSPVLIDKILTPAQAEVYGPPPCVQDQIVMV